MIRRTRQLAPLLLALTLVVSGCAVQGAKAPQLDAATVRDLNIASQLKQANSDYISFFTDLGKQTVDPKTLSEINVIGNDLKRVLDTANGLWQTYNSNHDQSLPTQISALLVTASADMAVLIAKKAGK